MHVGCSTLCFGNVPTPVALRTAREAGFTRVDLAAIRGIAEHVDVVGRPQLQAEDVRRAVAAHGLGVDALISVPWYPDALEDREELRRRYHELAAVAAAVGAKTLIVDANIRLPGEDRAQALERFRRTIDMAAEFVDAYRLTLAVEAPHAFTLAETLEQTLELLDIADHPSLGIDYDTSHVWHSGATVEASVAALGDRIVHVALRDVLEADRYGTPGDGLFDFPALVSALHVAGYSGPLTLELEPGDQHSLDQRGREAARGCGYVSALLLRHRAGNGPQD